MKKGSKVLSFILSLAVILSVVPLSAVEVIAAGETTPTLKIELVPNGGAAVPLEDGRVTSSGVATDGTIKITLAGVEGGNILNASLKYTPYQLTGAGVEQQELQATTVALTLTQSAFAVNTAEIPFAAGSTGFYTLSFLLSNFGSQMISFELVPETATVRYNGSYYTQFTDAWKAMNDAIAAADRGAAVSKEIVLVNNASSLVAADTLPGHRNDFYLNTEGVTINANGFSFDVVYTGKNLTLNNVSGQVGIAYYVTSGAVMPSVTVLKAAPDTKYLVGFMGDSIEGLTTSLGAIYANGFVDFEFLQGSMVAAQNVSVMVSGYTARDTGRGSVTLARTVDYPYAVAVQSENNEGITVSAFKFYDTLEAAVQAVPTEAVTISGIKDAVYVMAYMNLISQDFVNTYDVEVLPAEVSDGSITLKTFYRLTDGQQSVFFICPGTTTGYAFQYGNTTYLSELGAVIAGLLSENSTNAALNLESGTSSTAIRGGVDTKTEYTTISSGSTITVPGKYSLSGNLHVIIQPAAAGEFTIRSHSGSADIIIDPGNNFVNTINITGDVNEIDARSGNAVINIGQAGRDTNITGLKTDSSFYGILNARNTDFKYAELNGGNVNIFNSTVNAIGITDTAIRFLGGALLLQDSCVKAGGPEETTYTALLNTYDCGIYNTQIIVENSNQNSCGIGIFNDGWLQIGQREDIDFFSGELSDYSEEATQIEVQRGYGIRNRHSVGIASLDINIADDMANQGSVGIYSGGDYPDLALVTEMYNYFKEGGNNINVNVGGSRGTALFCENDSGLAVAGSKESMSFKADTALHVDMTPELIAVLEEYGINLITCGIFEGKIDITGGRDLSSLLPPYNYAVLEDGNKHTVVCEAYELHEYLRNGSSSKGEFQLHCDIVGGYELLSDELGCRYKGNMPALYEIAAALSFAIVGLGSDNMIDSAGIFGLPMDGINIGDLIPALLVAGIFTSEINSILMDLSEYEDLIFDQWGIAADNPIRQIIREYYPHGMKIATFSTLFGGLGSEYDIMRAEAYYNSVRSQTYYANTDNNVIDFNGHTMLSYDALIHEESLAGMSCIFDMYDMLPAFALLALSGVLPAFTVLDGELTFKSSSATATAGGVNMGAAVTVLVMDGYFCNGSKTARAADILNPHELISVILLAGKAELYGGAYNGAVASLLSDLDIYGGKYSGVLDLGAGLNYSGYTKIHGGEFYTGDILSFLAGWDDVSEERYNFVPVATAQLNLGEALYPIFSDNSADVFKLFNENSDISLVVSGGSVITDKQAIKDSYLITKESDLLPIFALSAIGKHCSPQSVAEGSYLKLVANEPETPSDPVSPGGSGSSGGGSSAPEKQVNEEFVRMAVEKFKDVNEDDYYAEAVGWALSKGITAGLTDELFGPKDICKRGQIVTFLWKAAGSPEPKTKVNPFKDVKESDYYYKSVLWAYENNITAGFTPEKFGPGVTCSNAHILTFLYKAMGAKVEKKPEDRWYDPALSWANELGLTEGTYTVWLDPNAGAPRANILVYMYRYFSEQ